MHTNLKNHHQFHQNPFFLSTNKKIKKKRNKKIKLKFLFLFLCLIFSLKAQLIITLIFYLATFPFMQTYKNKIKKNKNNHN